MAKKIAGSSPFLQRGLIGKVRAWHQRKKIGKTVRDHRLLAIDIGLISTLFPEGEYRNRAISLADALRCSDPMTSDELAPLEESIAHNVGLLKNELQEGELNVAKDRLGKLEMLIAERNEKCKALKR